MPKGVKWVEDAQRNEMRQRRAHTREKYVAGPKEAQQAQVKW